MLNNQLSELCEVYLLNNHKVQGLIPLLIFPDNSLIEDAERMKVLNIHYIWRISLKDQRLLDYIDLAYKDKVFYARKFITLSKRKVHEDGPEYDEFETIVIVLVLPEEISIFGKDLLLKITSEIILNFEGKIYKIIDSELSKREIIKTSTIKDTINKGDDIKTELMNLIDTVCTDFFSSIITQNKTESIEQQKAISFFATKGLKSESLGPLSIKSIGKNQNLSEIEIKAQNNTENEILNASIKITHLKDFLEKEIMKEKIDIWYPNEELLIGFPVLPKVNEYLLTIEKEDNVWITTKINLLLL